MSPKIRKDTALNLNLKGSIGSFNVGTGQEGQNSIEVKYFLTHVGLDFSGGFDEELLKHLKPVREMFDINQLDFDEIMQRDIDDARVSSELIPYLLDEKSADLVKLFPPIVVILLPVKEDENRPADLYPKLEEEQKEIDDQLTYILRSGKIGQEVFQFEQPIEDGEKLNHDLVRFRINTNKARLVIVDGQHRAMALLALYRNLKDQWSDERRAPFKEYYSEWTPQYIRQFNLEEINLPIILCTFPSLNEEYSGNFDLKKAARSVFLTLNKTARKVSESRNILLNDNDIIAYFLRRTLGRIKEIDSRSQYSLRIHNIELDQAEDKIKLKNPIAISGVSHLYYIIEHLLLNRGGTEDVNGIKPRAGKFYKRNDLNTFLLMDRLDGRNILGADVADSSKRDNFTTDTANKLGKSFDKQYGNYLISLLENFAPYHNHNNATLNLEVNIEANKDRQVKPILFEGQGISRVFENHLNNLKQKLKSEKFGTKVPEIQAIVERLQGTEKRLEKALEEFRKKRAELYINAIREKKIFKDDNNEIATQVVKWINEFYDNILTTVAFQTALICTFFGELEKANIKLKKDNEEILDSKKYFEEYINQLNTFFVPNTPGQFKQIVKIFKGEIRGNIAQWEIIERNLFKEIVYAGEMQPDQWTKYRYLLLEIWQPTNQNFCEIITSERQKCREQILSSLYSKYKDNYCKSNYKLESDLNNSELKAVFKDAINEYNNFLSILNAQTLLDEDEMKGVISAIPTVDFHDSNSED